MLPGTTPSLLSTSFFARFPEWSFSCPFLYQQPQILSSENEFKLIELYNYSFLLLPFIFLPCIKSLFSLCILSPYNYNSLLLSTILVYLSLSCFLLLSYPASSPTYNNKPKCPLTFFSFIHLLSPSSTRYRSLVR